MSRLSLGSIGSVLSTGGTNKKVATSAPPMESRPDDRHMDELWRRLSLAERERDRALRDRDEAISAKEDLERATLHTEAALHGDLDKLQQRCAKLQGLVEELSAAVKTSQHESKGLRTYVSELEDLVAANRRRRSVAGLGDELLEGLTGSLPLSVSRGSVLSKATSAVSTLEDELRNAGGSSCSEGSSCGFEPICIVEPPENALAGSGPSTSSRMSRMSFASSAVSAADDFLTGSQAMGTRIKRSPRDDRPGGGIAKDDKTPVARKELDQIIRRQRREIKKLRRRLADLAGSSSVPLSGVFDSLLDKVRELTREGSPTRGADLEAAATPHTTPSRAAATAASSPTARTCRVHSPSSGSSASAASRVQLVGLRINRLQAGGAAFADAGTPFVAGPAPVAEAAPSSPRTAGNTVRIKMQVNPNSEKRRSVSSTASSRTSSTKAGNTVQIGRPKVCMLKPPDRTTAAAPGSSKAAAVPANCPF